MNIVSLSLCYPSPSAPDAGQFVQRRLSALNEYHNVRVICPIPTNILTPPRSPRILIRGTKNKEALHTNPSPPDAWYVPMPYLPRITRPINAYLYARAVRPILSDWATNGDVDIIDAHFCWPDGVAAARLARQLGLPFTITLRGLLKRFANQITKRRGIIYALKSADAVLAVSQSLKDEAVQLGIAPQKIHVVPNGVDSDLFKPRDRNHARRLLDRTPDESIIITVGHLCRRKGVQRILQMLPELIRRRRNLHYVVVGADGGEGCFHRKLLRKVKQLGLQEHVTFTGALPQEKVALWLNAADLFVLATSNEGCCNAICEAQSAGLAIVTTDVGGNRELVDESISRIVPNGDGDAFRQAIQESLDAPRAVSERKSDGPRSWDQVARETSAILQSAFPGTAGTNPSPPDVHRDQSGIPKSKPKPKYHEATHHAI